MLTVDQYAKVFDYAILKQNTQETDIRKGCENARKYKFAAMYTTPCWAHVTTEELRGTGVHAGTGISFPYGTSYSKAKFLEIEESLKLGCTAIDLVTNIGALKDKNYALVRNEISELVRLCGTQALCKVIYEVCFLTDEEIAALTDICCELGVDYVKTSTGTEGFPDIAQVNIMKAHLTGGKTKLKVSGIPRTFSLPATLAMIDMGVELIGTRSAPVLVDQYREFLKNR